VNYLLHRQAKRRKIYEVNERNRSLRSTVINPNPSCTTKRHDRFVINDDRAGNRSASTTAAPGGGTRDFLRAIPEPEVDPDRASQELPILNKQENLPSGPSEEAVDGQKGGQVDRVSKSSADPVRRDRDSRHFQAPARTSRNLTPMPSGSLYVRSTGYPGRSARLLK
jgi:hypothetical protein